jgi:hypothetical protein
MTCFLSSPGGNGCLIGAGEYVQSFEVIKLLWMSPFTRLARSFAHIIVPAKGGIGRRMAGSLKGQDRRLGLYIRFD